MTADPHRGVVLRETILSVIINVVISGLFFLVMFGTSGPTPVGGTRGLALDFLPQALAIGFMGSLVPGLLVRRRVRTGGLPAIKGAAGRSSAAHAVIAALVSAVLLGGAAAAGLYMTALALLPHEVALAVKLVFGALVAAIVTPPAVRIALRVQPLQPTL